jgi:hypothetical protein
MPKGGGATRGRGRRDVGEDPRAADRARPGGRVGLPRLPRRHAPGGTVHVVGRCHTVRCVK